MLFNSAGQRVPAYSTLCFIMLPSVLTPIRLRIWVGDNYVGTRNAAKRLTGGQPSRPSGCWHGPLRYQQKWRGLNTSLQGAGIARWLERRTRDRKAASSNPGRSGGRIFFYRVNLVCLTLIRCPFHPRVTAKSRTKKENPFILPKVQVAGYT